MFVSKLILVKNDWTRGTAPLTDPKGIYSLILYLFTICTSYSMHIACKDLIHLPLLLTYDIMPSPFSPHADPIIIFVIQTCKTYMPTIW